MSTLEIHWDDSGQENSPHSLGKGTVSSKKLAHHDSVALGKSLSVGQASSDLSIFKLSALACFTLLVPQLRNSCLGYCDLASIHPHDLDGLKKTTRVETTDDNTGRK